MAENEKKKPKILAARSVHQKLPHTAKKALNWRMKHYGDIGDPPERDEEREEPRDPQGD